MRIVLWLTIFSILSVFSLAATDDFQYIAPNSHYACACSTLITYGSLENVGDVASHYYLASLGSAGSWVTHVPNYLSLSPGFREQIATFIQIPCDARGAYSLHTSVRTVFGVEKLHSASINVRHCDIIRVAPLATSAQVCAGDVATYRFTVTNVGPFSEQIVPSVDSSDARFDFNLPSYHLSAGASVPVYLYVASGSLTGRHSYSVSFNAVNSKLSYTIPITYDAIDCTLPSDYSERDSILLPFLLLLGMLLLLILLMLLIALAVRKTQRKRASPEYQEKLRLRAEEKLKKQALREQLREEKKRAAFEASTAKRIAKEEKRAMRKANVSADKQTSTHIASRSTSGKRKLPLWLLWLLLILLLMGLGTALWFTSLAVSSLDHVALNETNLTDTNLTDTNLTDITTPDTNLTEEVPPSDAIDDDALDTDEPTVYDDIDALLAERGYGFSCAVTITVLLVLFAASLLLFKIKISKKGKRSFLLRAARYVLSIALFLSLLGSFSFCMLTGYTTDWPGVCSVVIADGETFSTVGLNATELASYDEVSVETKPIGECFCTALFGFSGWICFLILLGILLLIALLVWLFMLVPIIRSWVATRAVKQAKAQKKQKSVASVEKTRSTKKVAEKVAATSVAQDSSGNIWRDILLLLVLLFILLGVGYYITSIYSGTAIDSDTPYNDTIHNDTLINETEALPDELIVDDDQEIEGELADDMVESTVIFHPANQNLVCDVTFLGVHDGEMIVPDVGLVRVSDAELSYIWQRERNGTVVDMPGGAVKSRDTILVGDIWTCMVVMDIGNVSFTTISEPYEVVLVPAVDDDSPSSVVDYVDSSDDETEINQTLVAVQELLAYIEEHNLTDSFDYLVMPSGTTREIVLSNYFFDPDGDDLAFSVLLAENVTGVSISIWRDIATIRAAPDFVGIVNATFVATDPQGATAQGAMTIVVHEQEALGWGSILIALIILLLILAIAFALLQRRPKE